MAGSVYGRNLNISSARKRTTESGSDVQCGRGQTAIEVGSPVQFSEGIEAMTTKKNRWCLMGTIMWELYSQDQTDVHIEKFQNLSSQ